MADRPAMFRDEQIVPATPVGLPLQYPPKISETVIGADGSTVPAIQGGASSSAPPPAGSVPAAGGTFTRQIINSIANKFYAIKNFIVGGKVTNDDDTQLETDETQRNLISNSTDRISSSAIGADPDKQKNTTTDTAFSTTHYTGNSSSDGSYFKKRTSVVSVVTDPNVARKRCYEDFVNTGEGGLNIGHAGSAPASTPLNTDNYSRPTEGDDDDIPTAIPGNFDAEIGIGNVQTKTSFLTKLQNIMKKYKYFVIGLAVMGLLGGLGLVFFWLLKPVLMKYIGIW